MNRLLMCPPKYYGVVYSINPHMRPEIPVDLELAWQQWSTLKQTYEQLGCEVDVLEPVSGWPDIVFTANAGFAIGPDQMIVSSFRYPERQGEEEHFQSWFGNNGFKVFKLGFPFEGQGEAFHWNGQILMSYGYRAVRESADLLEQQSGKLVIPLELVTPEIYHLDVGLAPIPSHGIIVYHPQAFSPESTQAIRSLKADFIEIDAHDAHAFGANLVVIGNTAILARGTHQLNEDLDKRGFNVIEVDMSEFLKSGGAVKCLTMTLD